MSTAIPTAVTFRRGPAPLRRGDAVGKRRRAFVKQLWPELWGTSDVEPIALECDAVTMPESVFGVLNSLDVKLQQLLWGLALDVFTKYGLYDHPWMIGPEEPWALVVEPYAHAHDRCDLYALQKDIEKLGLKLTVFPTERSPYFPKMTTAFVAYLDVAHYRAVESIAVGLKELARRAEAAR